MPRATLDEIRNLPDIIPADGFELLLGSIPGAGGQTRDLTLKCQTALIPGYSNETFEVPLHAHVVKFRGRKMYQRVLAVTFVESRDYSTTAKLRAWHEVCVGTIDGVSPQKSVYARTVALRVYSQQNEEIDEVKLYGFFPQDIADTTLDGTNTGGPMLVNATFSFDYFTGRGMDIA